MTSRVVGNGMLAKAFCKSESNNCVFFCSGVSMSSETDPVQFKRESDLLKSSLKENYCLVYFSSVLALSKHNKYYEHKHQMEELVRSLSSDYLIVRLPQVAGEVLNHTLLPSFIKKIYLNQPFYIYENAPRSIIDIDDVVILFDLLFSEGVRNETLNFCPGYDFQPKDLVEILGEILQKEPNYKFLDKESVQHCEQSEALSSHLGVFGDLNTYLERVAKKYTPKIVELINHQFITNI